MTLRCDRCHIIATGEQAAYAQPGRRHWISHAGFRGRNSEYFRRVTGCGTWVEEPKP